MAHDEIVGLLKYPWYALGITWLVTALLVKKTMRGEASLVAIARSVLLGAPLYVLYKVPPHWPWLYAQLIPKAPAMAWIGFALAVVGAAFGIWARIALGRNWSSRATIKTDHELVVCGPYRIVRNPIYTGIFFTLVGTAIALGQVRHFIGLPVLLGMWIWKIVAEQRLLREQFGESYVEYCRRVKAFIPYVV